MKKALKIFLCISCAVASAQTDENQVYKKRVLETTEVDFLSSYYAQKGDNAAVTGGIGTEQLTDATAAIIISIPLNDDDVLSVNTSISAYTSASSSNGNPFDITGASAGEGDDDDDDDDDGDDDDDDDDYNSGNGNAVGTPWNASTGASKKDTWFSVSIDYTHSSDDRDFSWNASASFATEYDYTSVGFGGGILKQFNQKNASIGASVHLYLDKWNPIYPTELKSFEEVNGNLTQGFFSGVTLLDHLGNTSIAWRPFNDFQLIQNTKRNSSAATFSFSQILSKNAQLSVFVDLLQQKGWLGNPLQRVYFGDMPNYYIGNAASIPNYTSKNNKDVFQLADDIERLPSTRFKTPFGMRLHYYLNENIVLRSYYRHYSDDWGVRSHTAQLEIPIKIATALTLYPSFRYYIQTAATYFRPYEQALSTDKYYTSDYDLSSYSATQLGFGLNYTDIFTKLHLASFGFKSIDLKFYQYNRDTSFSSYIITAGITLISD